MTDLGEAGTVAGGVVTLTVARPTLTRGEKIEATLANGLDRTIITEDAKSACSILLLQRSSATADTGWQDVPGCTLRRMPMVVATGPGKVRRITIDPSSDLFGIEVGPGAYRLRLTYRLDPSPGARDTDAATSPTFTIA